MLTVPCLQFLHPSAAGIRGLGVCCRTHYHPCHSFVVEVHMHACDSSVDIRADEAPRQVRAFSGNYGVPDWRGTDRRSRHRTWVEVCLFAANIGLCENCGAPRICYDFTRPSSSTAPPHLLALAPSSTLARICSNCLQNPSMLRGNSVRILTGASSWLPRSIRGRPS